MPRPPDAKKVKLWLPGQDDSDEEGQPTAGNGSDEVVAGLGLQPVETPGSDADYLSDLFIERAKQQESSLPGASGSGRPSVCPPCVQQKSMAQLRTEGLTTPLEASNKGFQMLQKMGFQLGQGLGREGAGRSEPVGVHLQQGRSGLGVQAECERKQQAKEQQRFEQVKQLQTQQESLRRDYRSTQSGRFAFRNASKNLASAQRVCEDLDVRKGIPRHSLWAPETELEPEQEALSNSDQTSVVQVQEQGVVLGEREPAVNAAPSPVEPPHWVTLEEVTGDLDHVIQYLRTTHFYCIYCGCEYIDQDDLQENCPGTSEEEH